VSLRLRHEVDVILLGLLLNQQAVGWLAAANRINYIPIFIPTLITTPLLPALSRSASDRLTFERTLRRSMQIVLLLTIPAAALMIALAPSIPDLLQWGPTFEHSIPVLMILALHQPLVAIDMVLGTGLIALHDERRWLGVSIGATILKPILSILAIPLFDQWLGNGAIGAAVTVVVAELLMLGGALLLLPRGMLDARTAHVGARIVVAGICLLATTAWLRPTSLPLAVAAGGLVLVVTVAALGVVRLDDLRAVHGMVRRSLSSRLAGARA
jgi:O-antigen/teichoic acid export membrane protein